jgi:hypothetical protein
MSRRFCRLDEDIVEDLTRLLVEIEEIPEDPAEGRGVLGIGIGMAGIPDPVLLLYLCPPPRVEVFTTVLVEIFDMVLAFLL